MTLSFTHGKVREGHTRRDFVPRSADVSLRDRNVEVVHSDDYRLDIERALEPAVARFNARQRRADRRKDAHDEVERLYSDSSQVQPVYSLVVSVGSAESIPIVDPSCDRDEWESLRNGDPERGVAGSERAASEYLAGHLLHDPATRDLQARQDACYEDIVRELRQRYPQMLVHEAIVHADEPFGTRHLTIDYTWLAGGEGSGTYRTGLDTRVSMTAALGELGYRTRYVGGRMVTAQTQWQDDAKRAIEDVMARHGFEREVVGDTRGHEDNHAFVSRKRRERAQADVMEAERRLVEANEAYERLERGREALEALIGGLESERDEAASELEATRGATARAKEDGTRAAEDEARARKAAAEARDEAARAREEAARLQAATDAARRRREEADREADEAEARRDKALAAQARAERAAAESEERARDAELDLDDLRRRIGTSQEYSDGLDATIREQREGLGVMAGRRPFGLGEVVAVVVDVCAVALDAAGHGSAASWLRDHADRMRERALDRLAPVPRPRELADWEERQGTQGTPDGPDLG